MTLQNSRIKNYSGGTLHRFGAAIVGIWITSSIINFIWPLPDQVDAKDSSIDTRRDQAF